MANRNVLHRKNCVDHIPSKGVLLDYCPNSPDTKHDFLQQEYEPEVKQCFYCNLLVIPEDQAKSESLRNCPSGGI